MTSLQVEPITYSMAEAALRLNIGYAWLKRQVAAGQVPHVRFGRTVRFTDDQLNEIILSRVRQPARPKTTARSKL